MGFRCAIHEKWSTPDAILWYWVWRVASQIASVQNGPHNKVTEAMRDLCVSEEL